MLLKNIYFEEHQIHVHVNIKGQLIISKNKQDIVWETIDSTLTLTHINNTIC